MLLLVGEVAQRNFGRGALQDGSAYGLQIVEMLRKRDQVRRRGARSAARAGAVAPRDPHGADRAARAGGADAADRLDAGHARRCVPIAVAVTGRAAEPVAPDGDRRAARASMRDGKRGVIFVGSGVRRGDGPQQLIELAERLQWPVMTTPKAKGVFPEDHPLSLGVFGMGGHLSASDYLEKGVDTHRSSSAPA